MRSNEGSEIAMAAELILAPEAEQDIDEAYAWYESRRFGLGEEFLSSVDACINAICRTPKMHATIHETFRRGLVRKFPYAVFYDFDGATVIVYCVFHTSQNPDKWRERLS
jgi:plasmid stabilization system protein ParE